MQDFTRYHQAVRYLEGLTNIAPKDDYMSGSKQPELCLLRARYFLNLLGNPQVGPNYIHVTGTAGKGTVASMLQQALVAGGHRTGLFTSPFITTTIEKLKVNDLYIDPRELADLVDELKPTIDKMLLECPFGRPSYFEVFTVLAFVYFKRQHCDWVVLEVGCGGRYDSTNVIPAPVAAVLTNISYDHTQILGKTLTKIARDKAGIIKPGCRFYTSEHRPRLLKIFSDICAELGVVMTAISTPLPELPYKKLNQALVGAVMNDLGLPNSLVDLRLKEVKLPCRFEIMQKNPLVVLDGAHNDAKLQTTLQNLPSLTYKRLWLIIGLAANKQAQTSLQQLVGQADVIIATRFQITQRKALPPQDLLALCTEPTRITHEYTTNGSRINQREKQFLIFSDPHQALDYALKNALSDDAILVTGSFYLTGDLRTRWYPEAEVLTRRQSW